MNKIKLFSLLLLSALLLLNACAVEESESTSEVNDRILKSWVAVNYPDKLEEVTAHGAYILDFSKGTGDQVGGDAYVFAHYSLSDLKGNCISSNIKELNEQVSGSSPSAYYGSEIWHLGEGGVYVGVEEVLKTMCVGGHVKLALPTRAAMTDLSIYTAFSTSVTGNMLMDIEIDSVVLDIKEYEDNRLKEFRDKYFPEADTLFDGFYFLKLKECTASEDSIPDGNTVSVRYVGRRMDNVVFDTNLQDSAKFYKMYDSSKEYDVLDVEYTAEIATMLDSDEVIDGFAHAIHSMNYGEKAVAFFRSEYGYAESGSGSSIPSYAPLCFYIHVINMTMTDDNGD